MLLLLLWFVFFMLLFLFVSLCIDVVICSVTYTSGFVSLIVGRRLADAARMVEWAMMVVFRELWGLCRKTSLLQRCVWCFSLPIHYEFVRGSILCTNCGGNMYWFISLTKMLLSPLTPLSTSLHLLFYFWYSVLWPWNGNRIYYLVNSPRCVCFVRLALWCNWHIIR